VSNGQQPWVLYLPFATTVYIYGYTNAAFSQKIVVTYENGQTLTMTGQGEGNRPTSPPTSVFTTPSSGSHLNGYQVTVAIFNQQSGKWVASQVAGAGCSLGWTAATYLVASEDWVDIDWNDAVLQFLWYNPPAVRNAALSARQAILDEAREAAHR
jgi:Fucose-binding lectin II (PA-IIL)